MIKKTFKLHANTGFARQASYLSNASSMFNAKLLITYQGNSVYIRKSPDSIMDILSLYILPGAYFSICADGIDEKIALETIEDILFD
ncbi:HPr family phosphocarrier protein [Niallia circulans]|uniref:HPr family phosphocarrier protein n=1 Tax=Niallia circulans TaxID=1397 RepID=A0A553SU09_NIACI|nr:MULTISPECIES: HPr family phosphocarrier protein [Niallia]MCT2347212.1 HPr family phosphocarrier protein [Niallia taxi]TRZ40461.1 HPr family phosphocarrier protein [Niallia circulans]